MKKAIAGETVENLILAYAPDVNRKMKKKKE